MTNPRPSARSTPGIRRPQPNKAPTAEAAPPPRGGPAGDSEPGAPRRARRPPHAPGCPSQRCTHGGLVTVHLGVLESRHDGLRRRAAGSRRGGGGGGRGGEGEAGRRPRGWGRVWGRGSSSRQQARRAAQAERRRRHRAAPCRHRAASAAPPAGSRRPGSRLGCGAGRQGRPSAAAMAPRPSDTAGFRRCSWLLVTVLRRDPPGFILYMVNVCKKIKSQVFILFPLGSAHKRLGSGLQSSPPLWPENRAAPCVGLILWF